MSASVCPQPEEGPTNQENQPSSGSKKSRQSKSTAKPVVVKCQDNVYSLAFLVDGKHVVSGGAGGNIQRWRLSDGMQVDAPVGAGAAVLNVAVSRDGKWLACGTGDGKVQVWNAAERHAKVKEIPGHRNWVRAVDFSPDGTKIASGSTDCTVCVWSTSTGERLCGPWEHDNHVVAGKFSPDGRLVATATWLRDSAGVRVYDAQDDRLLLLVDAAIRVNSWSNNSLVWASDGKRLFALSKDGNIHAVNASDGTASKWPIRRNDAECIALANNGSFLAASAGRSVSFWDTSTRKQVGNVIEYTHDIWSMAISDKYDLAVCGEKRISLRNIRDILPSYYFDGQSMTGDVRLWQKDGPSENGSSSSTIQEQTIVIDSRDAVFSVALLVDGMHFVIGGKEEKIRRYRVEDGREVGKSMDAGGVVCVAASQDGRWIVSGTDGGMLQLWKAATHEKVGEIKGHEKGVEAVDVSPDGTTFASGSADHTACVWSMSTGERRLGPWQHDQGVSVVKISPDGRLVATAVPKCSSVRVYDAQDGSRLCNVAIRVGAGKTLAWASDSKQLFALSKDSNVHCLDASIGTTLAKWAIQPHSSSKKMKIQCIALSSDDAFIVVSVESVVSVWNTTTKRQIGTPIQHAHRVWTMAISDNHDLVASGDKKISIRNIRDILPRSCLVNDAAKLDKTVQELRIQLAESVERILRERDNLSVLEENSSRSISLLEEENRELRGKLSEAQPTTSQQRETVRSVRFDIPVQETTPARPSYRQMDIWNAICNQLPTSQNTSNLENDSEDTTEALDVRGESQTGEMVQLEEIDQRLRNGLGDVRRTATEQTDSLRDIMRSLQSLTGLHPKETDPNCENARLKQANRELQHKTDTLARIVRTHERKHACEAMYAQGRIYDASESLLDMTNSMTKDDKANVILFDWLVDFTQRCTKALEDLGDVAWNAGKRDEAVDAYSAALSLSSSSQSVLLTKWASAILVGGSAREALITTGKFKASKFAIYRALCDVLEQDGRFTEAVECFRTMSRELPPEGHVGGRAEWEADFRVRCARNLVGLGDAARDVEKLEKASGYYLDAMSPRPTAFDQILPKHRNESHTGRGSMLR